MSEVVATRIAGGVACYLSSARGCGGAGPCLLLWSLLFGGAGRVYRVPRDAGANDVTAESGTSVGLLHKLLRTPSPTNLCRRPANAIMNAPPTNEGEPPRQASACDDFIHIYIVTHYILQHQVSVLDYIQRTAEEVGM